MPEPKKPAKLAPEKALEIKENLQLVALDLDKINHRRLKRLLQQIIDVKGRVELGYDENYTETYSETYNQSYDDDYSETYTETYNDQGYNETYNESDIIRKRIHRR
jgi:hypothetical protein